MGYLETIRRLKKDRGERPEPVPDAVPPYEINEKTPDEGLAASPLGRVNDQGERVMTLEDLPELERRLRSYGWQVERRGDQLVCRNSSPRSRRKAERKRESDSNKEAFER
jgi:hypothetical protein